MSTNAEFLQVSWNRMSTNGEFFSSALGVDLGADSREFHSYVSIRWNVNAKASLDCADIDCVL